MSKFSYDSADEEVTERINTLNERIKGWHANNIAKAEQDMAQHIISRDADVALLATWVALQKRAAI